MALIKDGIIQSFAIWDGQSEWDPGSDYEVIDVTGVLCDFNWIYNEESGEFSAPEGE